jgi:hypothetical protein
MEGGEGALPTIAVLAEKYARLNNLAAVEWIVHAVRFGPLLQKDFHKRCLYRTCQCTPGAILSNQYATIQMEFGLIKSAYAIFPSGKYLSLNTLPQCPFRTL